MASLPPGALHALHRLTERSLADDESECSDCFAVFPSPDFAEDWDLVKCMKCYATYLAEMPEDGNA